jgi:hypothetical protein
MRAIQVKPDTFEEIGSQLHPHDLEKITKWYYSMCMDTRTGQTHQWYFFVPKIELEGGHFIPARTMPYVELIRRFDFTLPEEGWFELTHKPGMERVV